MCVNDMAVSGNRKIIYIISDGILEKSLNGGVSFRRIPPPPGHTPPLRNVAVAPDDVNNIAVSDSRCNGNMVWVSTNSGLSWTKFVSPKSGRATVTDVAITPGVGSQRFYLVTVADDRTHNTSLGDVLMRSSTAYVISPWTSVGNVVGTHDYMCVAPSPNFASDWCICTVGVTPEKGVYYQLLSLNTLTVLQTVNLVPPGTTTDYCSFYSRGSRSIVSADIALSPSFLGADEAQRIAFVGIATSRTQSSDGVYRVLNNHASLIKPKKGMRSVAFNGDALFAGEYLSTWVWYSKDPLASTPGFRRVFPRKPGQWKALIRISPNGYYLGTSGLKGDFYSI